MGKLTKKNKQVREEFKTPLQRVGKKKLQPKNATNATVRTQAIIIPKQSHMVKTPSDTTEPTLRGQDMRTYLQQTRHHNANFRRNAIQGVLDLATKNEDHLPMWIGTIAQETTELSMDPDSQVRLRHKKLLELIAEKIPQSKLQQFTHFFGMTIVGALTHVQRDVREHGLALARIPFLAKSSPRVPNLIFSYLAAAPSNALLVTPSLFPILVHEHDKLMQFIVESRQSNEEHNGIEDDQQRQAISSTIALSSKLSGVPSRDLWPIPPSPQVADAETRQKNLPSQLKALLNAYLQLDDHTTTTASSNARHNNKSSTEQKAISLENAWRSIHIMETLSQLLKIATLDAEFVLDNRKEQQLAIFPVVNDLFTQILGITSTSPAAQPRLAVVCVESDGVNQELEIRHVDLLLHLICLVRNACTVLIDDPEAVEKVQGRDRHISSRIANQLPSLLFYTVRFLHKIANFSVETAPPATTDHLSFAICGLIRVFSELSHLNHLIPQLAQTVDKHTAENAMEQINAAEIMATRTLAELSLFHPETKPARNFILSLPILFTLISKDGNTFSTYQQYLHINTSVAEACRRYIDLSPSHFFSRHRDGVSLLETVCEEGHEINWQKLLSSALNDPGCPHDVVFNFCRLGKVFKQRPQALLEFILDDQHSAYCLADEDSRIACLKLALALEPTATQEEEWSLNAVADVYPNLSDNEACSMLEILVSEAGNDVNALLRQVLALAPGTEDLSVDAEFLSGQLDNLSHFAERFAVSGTDICAYIRDEGGEMAWRVKEGEPHAITAVSGALWMVMLVVRCLPKRGMLKGLLMGGGGYFGDASTALRYGLFSKEFLELGAGLDVGSILGGSLIWRSVLDSLFGSRNHNGLTLGVVLAVCLLRVGCLEKGLEGYDVFKLGLYRDLSVLGGLFGVRCVLGLVRGEMVIFEGWDGEGFVVAGGEGDLMRLEGECRGDLLKLCGSVGVSAEVEQLLSIARGSLITAAAAAAALHRRS